MRGAGEIAPQAMKEGSESVRYRAFISYSHADRTWWGEPWGSYLHRRIEGFPLPAGDGVAASEYIRPVFRDRDELAAHGDLGERLESALRESDYLVVVCSRTAARSVHVNREVAYFKSLGRSRNVLCFIVDGVPGSSGAARERSTDECFPDAVRFKVGSNALILDEPVQPIAADARRGRDGRANAVLKILATLSGRPYDHLRQREQARQLRRRTVAIGAMSIVVVGLASLSYIALTQRNEALRQAQVSMARMLAARAPVEQQQLRQDVLAARMALEGYVRDRDSGKEATAEIDQALRLVLRQPHFTKIAGTLASADYPSYQVSDDGAWTVSWSNKKLSIGRLEDRGLAFVLSQQGAVESAVIDGAEPAVLIVSRSGAEVLAADGSGKFGRRKLAGWPQRFWPVIVDSRRGVALARDFEGCHALVAFQLTATEPTCLFRAKSEVFAYGRSGNRTRFAVTSFSPPRLWLVDMLSSKVRTINLKTISDGVQSVAMDHAGRRIAIGSHTGHVWLLDSDGKTDLRKLGVTEGGSVNAVTFAADDRKVAAGTQDGVMTIWNLMEPSAPALKLRGHAVPFDFLVENKLRQEVISVDMSGLLRRWSMDPAASEPAVLNVTAYQQLLFPPKIHALAFRPRSTEFVVAGDHGLFQLWDMRRLGDPPKVFDLGGPQVHVMAAGFAADGTTLAAATVYGEVKSWRLAGSAVPAGNFRLPTGGVPWVITPVGNSAFAIADNKGSVTLWPGAPDSPWKTMKVHSQNVRSASTATDAMRLFTGSDDGGVNAIELKGEGPFGLSSVKAILPARQNVSVTGLAASPDGHWLAITETTGVRLLELGASGERSIELRDATFSASCVALSPDNKRIAAGGSDGVLRVWSTERPDLKPVLLSGHTAAVRYVAFSPDGHHLVSGSYDSTVRIWAASTEALVRRACGLLFGDGNPLSEPADIDSRWRMACGG